MPRLVAVLILLAAVAVGCRSTPSEPAPNPPTNGASEPVGGDPVALIGVWAVREAGEEAGAVLILDLYSLGLYRECGRLNGDWRALPDGMFVAGLVSGSGHCGLDSWPAWLAEATVHRADGDGHLLLDESGAVLARLVPERIEAVSRSADAALAEAPAVTSEARRELAPAEPLPDDATPVDAESLLGHWVPSDAPPRSEGHLRFDHDGSWHGSDGCNRVGGRWLSGPDGALLGTTGITTAIGCENLPVASHMGKVTRAGFQGETLVLFDRRGLALGVYHPVP